MNNFAIKNNELMFNEADEQEWCLSHDIFLLARALTEDEKKQLYDPAKDQMPSLVQVRKRLNQYQSAFSQKPKVLTNITLTPADEHEHALKTLNSVKTLHAKAKEIATVAFTAKMEKQTDKVKLLYKQAFDYERKAAMLSAEDIEPTHFMLFKSAANLALEADRYEEAVEIIELGLSHDLTIEMTEELLGLLDYLADIYYEKGEYSKAQPLLEKTLAIRYDKLEEEHWDIPNSLNSLGLLYQAQGEYDKAEPLLEKALAIHEKILDAEHPDVAMSLNNLGSLYQKQGEYDKAQPLLEKALAIREKTLETDHIDVATSLNNLGFLYQEQAKLLFEKALTILQKRLGNHHPYVNITHNHLVWLLQGRQ
ncbi:MAG TPA: tetratricopeptide repeat protein [Thiotrichaceae bacterium]|nr:tetratricopeptide repeat protein [Thiotrichaceae bacterium]